MRFKLDENIPRLVQQALQAGGHDVHTVHDEALAGADDARLLACCVRERRVLVTLDLDFSNLRAYPTAQHAGIWVLRPPRQTFQEVLRLVEGALRLAAQEAVDRRLWIVDERRVRIRIRGDGEQSTAGG